MTARSLMIALAVTWVGCTGNAPHKQSGPGALGKLELNLIGSDSHGQQYRLRNAEFTIAGYSYYNGSNNYLETVSSDTDPDAEYIVSQLTPGEYYITLENKLWYLEKLTPNGPERVEKAVLLSSPNVYTYVDQNRTSTVEFTFGVDGELIDFRHGKLRIGIDIELPSDSDAGFEQPPQEDAGSF